MRKAQNNEPKYKKVLLIDENEIDNFINERIITSCNFAEQVVVKDSGPGALDYLNDVIKKEQSLPEIIFLDLNMPLMDGFAFLDEFDKLVLTHPYVQNHTRVIVLSSSISPTDIDRASTNPYVFKYINKPLSEKYLGAINI